MVKVISGCLILASLFITLEIYRIPVMGYNATFSHLFLAVALFLGSLTILLNARLRIDRGVRLALGTLIVFGSYSLLVFLKNADIMRREVGSMFMVELIGYAMVLTILLFINNWGNLRRLTMAFLASAFFVYLGAFWHMFVFVTRGEKITGVPFWYIFTPSEHVLAYLEAAAGFAGFPRFVLPFSSPAGTGLFLSLSGILLLALALHRVASKRKVPWWLVLLNLINFLCLVGTFARASWVIFLIGSLVVLWYFYKFRLITFRRISLTALIAAGLLFATISIVPIGDEFTRAVVLRFDPEHTRMSDVGHLESRMLALHYWTENPIVGLGVGGFWEKPGGGIHTHSTYFTILVERGIVGLFLFLAFLFQIFHLLKRKMRITRKYNDMTMLTYNIAFLSGVIGLFFGHLLYQMSSEVTWLYYGIVLAYVNLRLPQGVEHQIGAKL
jgi:O-antigen ligase